MPTADTCHQSTTRAGRPADSAAACVVPAEARSVPGMRRFARTVARHWRLPESVTDAAALIVTELATNAVRHSASPDVAVLIGLRPHTLTIEVRDRGQWRAAPASTVLDSGGGALAGRGLALVNAYSTGCMLWCDPDGTRAVAKVPVPHPG
ncbi:ATP-binding protein [Kitasatospora sp. NPDC049285]|uniref:ATP-binding protein n=1 Tax=Kitasatospora sp. NPDC049285 TaxID=3157096 RepID=UPI003417E029